MSTIVEVERSIPFPVERVFAAWLIPEKFAEWFLPDPNVKLGKVQLDPKVGGKFLIEMILGGNTLPHTGEYRSIVPNQSIAFTWHSGMTGDGETLVEVTFRPKGAETLLTLRHTGLNSAESRQAHSGGWTHIVESLIPHLSKSK